MKNQNTYTQIIDKYNDLENNINTIISIIYNK